VHADAFGGHHTLFVSHVRQMLAAAGPLGHEMDAFLPVAVVGQTPSAKQLVHVAMLVHRDETVRIIDDAQTHTQMLPFTHSGIDVLVFTNVYPLVQLHVPDTLLHELPIAQIDDDVHGCVTDTTCGMQMYRASVEE
jgi:hypothetical protein